MVRPSPRSLALCLGAIVLFARGAYAVSLVVSLSPPPGSIVEVPGDPAWNAFARGDFLETERLLRARKDVDTNPDTATGLGFVIHRLGRHEEAMPLLERGIASYRKRTPSSERTRNLADALVVLGNAKRARGEPLAALPHLEEAVSLRRSIQPAEDLLIGYHAADLAGAEWDLGRYARAIEGYELAVAAIARAQGKGTADYALALRNLGIAQRSAGRPADAEKSLRRALVVQEAMPAPPAEIASTLSPLGLAELELGRRDDALATTSRAFALREASLGPRHLDTAASLQNLGIVRNQVGDNTGSEQAFRNALAIHEAELGPVAIEVGDSLQGVGNALLNRNEPRAAYELWSRAVKIHEKGLPPHHPTLAISLLGRGRSECALSEFGKAEKSMRRAIAIEEKAFGPDYADGWKSLATLAPCLASGTQHEKAAELFRQAISRIERQYGPRDFRLTGVLAQAGANAKVMGDEAGAAALFEKALPLAVGGNAEADEHALLILAGAAWPRLVRGDLAGAASLYGKALSFAEQLQRPGDPRVAEVLVGLGMSVGGLKQWEATERSLSRAVALLDSAGRLESNPNVLYVLQLLGAAQYERGKMRESESTFSRRLALARKRHGPAHPETSSAENDLAFVRGATASKR